MASSSSVKSSGTNLGYRWGFFGLEAKRGLVRYRYWHIIGGRALSCRAWGSTIDSATVGGPGLLRVIGVWWLGPSVVRNQNKREFVTEEI